MSVWQRRLFLAACAITVSGCGGSLQTDRAVLPPQVRAKPHSGWMSPEAKSAKALLYVADPTGDPSYQGVIDVFAINGLKYKLVGQISDDNNPQGMTTDADGKLYVTDIGVATEGPSVGDIKIFPKGAIHYSRIIVPADWVPFDIAVGHDGTFYVANIAPIGYFNPGSVSIYPPLATVPSRVLQFNNFQVDGIALHRKSNTIYVAYDGTGGTGGSINEFVHARGKPKNLGVSYSAPWSVREDGADNLLACSGEGSVNVYAESDGHLVQQISVPNGAMFEAFNKSRSKLFVSDFAKVEIYSYPAGQLIGNINQSGWGGVNYPTGVAYWPPPR
jgi:sugar lactone lactonase YvrE